LPWGTLAGRREPRSQFLPGVRLRGRELLRTEPYCDELRSQPALGVCRARPPADRFGSADRADGAERADSTALPDRAAFRARFLPPARPEPLENVLFLEKMGRAGRLIGRLVVGRPGAASERSQPLRGARDWYRAGRAGSAADATASSVPRVRSQFLPGVRGWRPPALVRARFAAAKFSLGVRPPASGSGEPAE
jgi:hypothetical protein